MGFIQKENEITAYQVKPEAYEEIASALSGYYVKDGSLYSPDGVKKQDNMWIVQFSKDGGKVEKCLSDSLFRLLFEEEPARHYTLGELASAGAKAKKDEFPEGDYVMWNGFTWTIHMSGVDSIYCPTPEEITEELWVEA